MQIRPNLTNAFFGRFAGRKSLTVHATLDAASAPYLRKLTGVQSLPGKSDGLLGRLTLDALVFEFMGLAMLALCVIVLVVPSARKPSGRRVSDF
jgi:hypothetical protein